jgi:hypothetical protein
MKQDEKGRAEKKVKHPSIVDLFKQISETNMRIAEKRKRFEEERSKWGVRKTKQKK